MPVYSGLKPRGLPVLLVLLAGSMAAAQTSSGVIAGRVLDPAGGAIAGAKVELRAPQIGLARTAATGETGNFVFLTLPPATYTITVAHPGFQTQEHTGIAITAEARVTLPVVLRLGEVTETVVVEGAAPLVDVATGETAREISAGQLQGLALAGRYSYMVLGLLPGVAARGGAFLSDFRSTSVSMGGLQINGQRKETNFISIDGVSNTQLRSGVSMNQRVGVDFVDEVKVLTTHYAAEYGRSTGTQIQFVTKRGSKDFHGSASNYLANDALNARRFLTGAKNPLRYNNPGWTLGGPVILPGKWNRNRDRLFFFAGQELRRLAGTGEQIAVVPTERERNLDFSASPQRPVDPAAGQPFPNGVIPQSRLSETGAALLKIWPRPNYTGPGGNFLSSRNQPIQSNDWIVRGDYNISRSLQLSGRVMRSRQSVTGPYDDTGNRIPLFEIETTETGWNAGGSLVATFGPSMVNEFVMGYAARREAYELLGEGANRSVYGLRFPEIFPGNRESRIPQINISGYSSISGSVHPTFFFTPSWIFRDNFSRLRGRHAFKTGFYYERMAMDDVTRANDNGTFTFGASAQNPLSTRSPLANAMLGIFDTYAEDSASFQAPYRTSVLEFYVQDTWRVRPNLSLEFGLRYSLIPTWWSASNALAAFRINAWDPAKAPQVAANGSLVPNTGDPFNGIVVPGSTLPANADPAAAGTVRNLPRGFFETGRKNFQPRVSFAWSPGRDGRTAIRGGAGVFRGVAGLRDSGFQLAGNPPFIQQVTITNGLASNPASGVLSTTRFPINATAFPGRFPLPLVVTYSLGVQRQLDQATLVDASYVGSTASYVLRSRPLNFVSPEVQAANQGRDLRPLYPYRGLGNLNLVEPAANSLYSSLQTSLTRRLRNNLSYSFSYTLAKNIGYTYQGVASAPQNPLDYRSERSEIQESRRHYAVINGIYELPWMRSQPGLPGRVLGGWQLSAVATLGGGRLHSPTLTSAARQIATRPDVLRPPELPSGERSVFRWFDTTAFARPAAFTFGNAGNNIIRGPGIRTVDLFLLKNTRLTERVNVQFRAEAFNALNHPVYNEVSTNLGAANFGQITGAASSRAIQLGLRVLF